MLIIKLPEQEFFDQIGLNEQIEDLRDKRPGDECYQILYLHGHNPPLNCLLVDPLTINVPGSAEEVHKHARCNENQQQTGNETIDTGGLCDCAAQKHG